MASIFATMAAGGGAPATMPRTVQSIPSRQLAGALASAAWTMGAAQ